jgi:glycosyltransferase involved in cell wall biosynthesis
LPDGMNNPSQRKKILQLRSSFGYFGAENVIAELTKELACSEYTPFIGVFNNKQNPHLELADFALKNNIEFRIFNCRGAFDLKTILSLRDFIQKENITIVQTHGYKANVYILFATLFIKIPLIATCHPWIKTNRKIRIYTIIDKLLLNRFNKIIAISAEVKREILAMRIPSEKVFLIDNGIDIGRFEKRFDREKIRRKFGIPLQGKVICTVGRLSSEKGHLTLLAAAKKILNTHPPLYFVIAGEGALKTELMNETKKLRIDDHFIFTGMVDDIPALLSVSDIFVLPSLTEGLPMALLEAMAAKKPVIASRVGSIPEVLSANGAGLLVPPANSQELEKSILDLLNNQQKADEMAENGYRTIVNRYSSKIMVRKYLDIYAECSAG